jgi:formyltetrahydrofolate deformylase
VPAPANCYISALLMDQSPSLSQVTRPRDGRGPTPAGRLLVSCADRPGIVAAISSFLTAFGANIVESDQHTTDPEGGQFFMRVEFTHPTLDDVRAEFERGFTEIADRFEMTWRIAYASDRKRVALMVSRDDHCLLDLLWRWRRAELECDIRVVVSNHPDLAVDAEAFGVPYRHVPVEKGRKAQAEEQLLEILHGHADLVVLARYMQILTRDFLDRVGCPIINIHHSFLPAFAGADPYARARERGVKLIGATAHYVTEELDAGPIIEQGTERVTHRDSAEALERIGRDVERTVLARAVKWHLEDRVLLHENRTVVF